MYRASWGTKPLRGHIKFGKAKLGTPRASERAVLRLEGGDQVVRFERLRYLEHRPFAYELVCIPERRFPNLMLHCPVADDLQELAQISGIVVARAEGKVRALAVPSVVATALSIAEGSVALCLERIAFDRDDEPVELMTAYYDLKNGYRGPAMR